jgi:hypothetical protein
MPNQSPSERKQFWLNHLTAWQQSGLTQAAYCQTHELKIKNFWYWKRKNSIQRLNLTQKQRILFNYLHLPYHMLNQLMNSVLFYPMVSA